MTGVSETAGPVRAWLCVMMPPSATSNPHAGELDLQATDDMSAATVDSDRLPLTEKHKFYVRC